MFKALKNNIIKYSDQCILLLCIVTYVVGFLCRMPLLEIIAGLFGAIYCIRYLVFFFCKPIKRDWLLAKGNFLAKVINFVLFIPVTITAIIHVVNIGFDISNKYFSPNYYHLSSKDLVYEENLYTNDNTETEIFGTIISGNTAEKDGKAGTILKQSNLPDSISKKQEDPSLLWTVYYNFIDPGNQHMTTTHRGRIISGIVATLGFLLLNGLLISMLINWFDRRREQWLKGEIRYKLRNIGKYKYAIIIGANEIAPSVIKNLFTPKKPGEINYKCEGENKYVILQTSRDIEEVRTELASHLSENLLKRVIIYKALRDSKDEVEKLNPGYSTEIYVLGESTLLDGGESYHDAMNMHCVKLIVKELENTKDKRRKEKNSNGISTKKVCKVMFEYQTTSSIFQYSDISQNIKDNIIFIPFNRYESWARAVIADNTATLEDVSQSCKELCYTPLDGNAGISEDNDNHVHFVIVGMSKTGIAMGVQAMLQAHYLNFAKAEMEKDTAKRTTLKNKRRTRITFIDTNADKEMAFFKGRYENLFKLTRHRYIDANNCDKEELIADYEKNWVDPVVPTKGNVENWQHLSDYNDNFIDIEIEFIKGELESEGVRKYLSNISDTTNEWVMNSKLTIAVCLTMTHQAVAAGLYMPVPVYEKAQEIWVYQQESADIVQNLNESTQNDKRYKKLKPFGMLYGEYMNDRTQYLKALMVNGAYDLNGKIEGKEIKAEERDFTKEETYSDLRASWKKLSIDKKFSNRYFADSISLKIRSIKAVGLSIKELDEAIKRHEEILARSEHNRWNIQQLIQGYAPCDKLLDKEFATLNATYKADNDALREWCERNGWKNLSEEKRKEIKASDSTYKELESNNNKSKAAFKSKKDDCKEGENRIHPNICAYDHLDDIDFGAKSYDIFLNSIIPTIRLLIDDRIGDNCKEDNGE